MILILTGPVQSGKTTALKDLLPLLSARKVPISGYLSLAVLHRGRICGYDLFDFDSGSLIPLLRRKGRAGWQKVGPYYFLPSGLRAAEDRILGCPGGGWLVVDEVGPRELAGGGVWPALSAVLSRPQVDCLLVVRKTLIDEVRSLLGEQPVEVFDIAAGNLVPALLERLSASCVRANHD